MQNAMLSVLALSTYALNSATADEEALIAAVKAFAAASNVQDQYPLGFDALKEAKKGTRPDVVGKDGESALHLLAWSRYFMMRGDSPHYGLFEIFFKTPNLNINVQNKLGQTPLYLAAEGNVDLSEEADLQFMREQSRILEKLLNAGANPNIASKSNTTPLSIAAENGYLKGIKLLLEKGAQTRVANQWGNDAVKNAERSTKNKGTKWQAIGIIKDWQDTHPGQ
jgi:ankyrin repeat protein